MDITKLLGLLEDLAVIAFDAETTDGLIAISIKSLGVMNDKQKPVEVHLREEVFDALKKDNPAKMIEIEELSSTMTRESMVFFDKIKVFRLRRRTEKEVV